MAVEEVVPLDLSSAHFSPILFHMSFKRSMSRQNGLAIRHLRIKDGTKPGEFATKARISYSTLDNIENERKNASPEVLHRIAQALDVPIGALLRDPSLFAESEGAA